MAFDVSKGVNAQISLTTSRIVGLPTNANPGDRGILRVIQPAGGSALVTWHANWRFVGGTNTVVSTGANAIDDIQWWTPDGVTFVVLSATLAVAP